ncbi:metal ABC transporter ATP-binding protein [Paroceanicella profunda]|uniref:Metal ABC transporter ATP-binding protein n=1 Tax=Paroceanicella profunda TaxID=2579971 RepID=A0A5B8FX77_9RHOB|nr:metal ABC transporter ATP-binding protein [Paroceanicella profunda]
MTALIRTEALTFRQGGRSILENIDLSVAPGEIVTLIGPNGGGKTTLLRLLIGTLHAGSGRILRRPGLRLGYTPQKMQIEKTMPMRVGRFLSLSGGLKHGARDAVLARVGALGLEGAQLSDLSGGELQRVLLARALLRDPQLLILDEPTQGLDQPAEAAFYRLVSEIRAERGVAILLVSHDLHVVMGACDRVICLNGHVCCSGAPEHVTADPAYHRMFGARADFALYRHHHDHSHDHAPAAGAAPASAAAQAHGSDAPHTRHGDAAAGPRPLLPPTGPGPEGGDAPGPEHRHDHAAS